MKIIAVSTIFFNSGLSLKTEVWPLSLLSSGEWIITGAPACSGSSKATHLYPDLYAGPDTNTHVSHCEGSWTGSRVSSRVPEWVTTLETTGAGVVMVACVHYFFTQTACRGVHATSSVVSSHSHQGSGGKRGMEKGANRSKIGHKSCLFAGSSNFQLSTWKLLGELHT